MVSAARGGHRIGFDEQVLGSDLEGSVAIRLLEKEHRVGEGVKVEVSPVFG